jgi:hypothetical protein
MSNNQQEEEPISFQLEEEEEPPQAAPPQFQMAPPPQKPRGQQFQCPECRRIFIVAMSKRPLHIRCPYCGLEGMID